MVYLQKGVDLQQGVNPTPGIVSHPSIVPAQYFLLIFDESKTNPKHLLKVWTDLAIPRHTSLVLSLEMVGSNPALVLPFISNLE